MKIDITRLQFKKLDATAIPALLEIQEETFAYANGNTDFLRRNTAETLAVCFTEPSAVLGVFYEDSLIAFGILHVAGTTKENLAYDVEEIKNVTDSANVKLIIVRPQFRGNGIQRMLIDRLQNIAKETGHAWICATVAPDNVWSLNNFLKCGLREIKILEKYGGMKRTLLCKKI